MICSFPADRFEGNLIFLKIFKSNNSKNFQKIKFLSKIFAGNEDSKNIFYGKIR